MPDEKYVPKQEKRPRERGEKRREGRLRSRIKAGCKNRNYKARN